MGWDCSQGCAAHRAPPPPPFPARGRTFCRTEYRHSCGEAASAVIERGAVVAEDRDAVMIRAAAQELHHVRAVGELEAEHVHEKRNLIVGACAVEDDVTDLGRP